MPNTLRLLPILVSIPLVLAAQSDARDPRKLTGFDPGTVDRQLALESRFDALVRKENLATWMKRLTARPHHLGSPYGKELAEFIAALFRSWGYETAIERFDVLFPTPTMRRVEMVAPTRYTAGLAEPALAQDATSAQVAEQLPVYNAYSIPGDVIAPLVYVNYGVPDDYRALAERGIDVKGKIVIARYGGSWRGIKPKVAAEHGAVGCLIYSDPRDDGYFRGDVYPQGSWRSEWGAQRGSVADMPLYPGDPLTPGVGAVAGAERLEMMKAPTLTKIPVLPIAHGDALPLLRALGGPVAPETWRGALPITYHLGPGPATVHLEVDFKFGLVPAYDVIARLRGSERADEWVLRGNHHDAWVNGADDPASGLVALLEEARVIGELARGGWRPKRSIVYAAWDGEEPGLLGSTEWVETHLAELRAHAVAYINSDSNGRGFLNIGGSHTLEPFANEIARDVTDPQKGIAVRERERARLLVRGDATERTEARSREDLRIDALGSGSDWTPFLQHAGIASLSIGFGGEDGGGSFHSIYDSLDHYTRFGDPGFAYGAALAKVGGRAVLRLAQADILPFTMGSVAETIGRYADEVVKLSSEAREAIDEQNRRIRDRTFEAAADPRETYVAPSPEAPAPYLNFAPLQNAVARLKESAARYEAAATGATRLPAGQRQALDDILRTFEHALTRPAGLPRRAWFKHQIYAPGFYTGYGVKTLPGVREAIEQHAWKEAEEQIAIVAATIERAAAHVDRATDVVNR